MMDERINEQEQKFLRILSKMLVIRTFEERVAQIAKNEEIQCPVHLYTGQEAIAASVCADLNSHSASSPTAIALRTSSSSIILLQYLQKFPNRIFSIPRIGNFDKCPTP